MLTPRLRRFVANIIESLDEKGYLRESVLRRNRFCAEFPQNRSGKMCFGCGKSRYGSRGVGASNLRECLTIQAGRLPEIDPQSSQSSTNISNFWLKIGLKKSPGG